MKSNNLLKILSVLAVIGIPSNNYIEDNSHIETNYKHPFALKTEKEFQRKKLSNEMIEIRDNINIEYQKIKFLEQRIGSDKYTKETKEKYTSILNESYSKYKNLIHKKDSIYRILSKI